MWRNRIELGKERREGKKTKQLEKSNSQRTSHGSDRLWNEVFYSILVLGFQENERRRNREKRELLVRRRVQESD